jgi:hypothetical protein
MKNPLHRGDLPVVTKEGDKAIRELEKSRELEKENTKKKYEDAHTKMMDKYGEVKESRMRFWAKKKTENDFEDPKFWVLVNTGAIKEFIKYGSNKVMDQIRVRTHAKIEAREEIEKLRKQQKGGFDAKQVAFTLLIIAVVGVLAYVIMTNFLNYQAMAGENIKLQRTIGEKEGDLAVCARQLKQFIPDAFPQIQTANNTLVG